MRVETLERRMQLDGGIDDSFGGRNGALFDMPGDDVFHTIKRSFVDSAGRTVLFGHSGDTSTEQERMQMLIARLDRNGALDTSFSEDGMLLGTPRGFNDPVDVLALRGGGYLVADQFNQRILRLRDDGFIDRGFGRNGTVTMVRGIFPTQMLERADGSIWVIGYQGDFGGDNSTWGVVTRILLDGSPADPARRPVSLGTFSLSDIFISNSGSVEHAVTTADGTLWLLVRTNSFGDDSRSSYLKVHRISDTSAGSGVVTRYDSYESTTRNFGSARIVSVGDTSVQVLTSLVPRPGESTEQLVVFNAPLPGATEEFNEADAPKTELSKAFDFNWNGPVVRLLDGSIVLGGTTPDQPTRARPALIKYVADLARDTGFGTSGRLIQLPGDVPSTESMRLLDLSLTPDGMLQGTTNWYRGRFENDLDYAHRVVRFFRDDRPIASLVRAKSYSTHTRITVEFKSTGSIDTATLGNNELRLGGRVLRLMGFTREGDNIIATYRLNKGQLTKGSYDLRSVADAVSTTAGEGLIARRLGTVRIK